MILGANHIAISVPNMDAALAFYCDLIGFEKLTDLGWPAGSEKFDTILGVAGTSARIVHVGVGNLMIEIFEFGDCDPMPQARDRPVIDHGYTHLCLAVTDIKAEYERLTVGGMEFHSEPVRVNERVRSVYGRDPFGNVIELEEVIGRTQAHQPI